MLLRQHNRAAVQFDLFVRIIFKISPRFDKHGMLPVNALEQIKLLEQTLSR